MYLPINSGAEGNTLSECLVLKMLNILFQLFHLTLNTSSTCAPETASAPEGSPTAPIILAPNAS